MEPLVIPLIVLAALWGLYGLVRWLFQAKVALNKSLVPDDIWINFAQMMGGEHLENGQGVVEHFRRAGLASISPSGDVDHLVQITEGGVEATIFTQYSGPESADAVPHSLTACVFATGGAFPQLLIAPESELDRVKQTFGAMDIDFESDEFSRAFRVRCADRGFAHAVLHPRAMELLLERGRNICWEWGGEFAMAYYKHLAPPSDAALLYYLGREFLGMIPSFVRQDYGTSASQR